MILPIFLFITNIGIQPHSLIEIRTESSEGNSVGSGVIIAKNKVLTAAHVVDGATTLTASCGGRKIPAKVLNMLPSVDLALIEYLQDCPIEPVTLAPENPPPASDIYAVGCPAGRCFLVTKGIVSGYFSRRGVTKMYSDIKIWYGNSGGAVLDDHNNLVGIVSAITWFSTIEMENKRLEVNSQNYAVIIPISVIKTFLDETAKR